MSRSSNFFSSLRIKIQNELPTNPVAACLAQYPTERFTSLETHKRAVETVKKAFCVSEIVKCSVGLVVLSFAFAHLTSVTYQKKKVRSSFEACGNLAKPWHR